MSSWTAFKESSLSPLLCSSMQNSNFAFFPVPGLVNLPGSWCIPPGGAEPCPSGPVKRGISLMHCLNKGETMSMNN